MSDLKYNPSDLKPGVVHIGLGGFARAFVMDYFHDVAERGHTDWGVVGVKPNTPHTPDFDDEKNHAYTLVTRNGGEHQRTLGALRGVIGGQSHPDKVIHQLANPDTKLVTLTITHMGYCLDGFNRPDLERLERDILAIKRERLSNVHTVPGWIVASLYERYHRGHELPPTVLSLDNLPKNGNLTQQVVKGLAEQLGPGFASYVDGVAFPNSVVDRIVPPCTPDQFRECANIIGRPILAEEHRSLFIEDRFISGSKPPLNEVGAQYVTDIGPYENLKLRVLNGGHLALAVVAKVMGITMVHDAVDGAKNPALRHYLEEFLAQAANALRPKPDVDLASHQASALTRFANEKIPDSVDRLLRSTDAKVTSRLFSAAALEHNLPRSAAAFSIAAWLRYMHGHDDAGNKYELQAEDKHAPRIRSADDLTARLHSSELDWNTVSQFSHEVFRDLKLMQKKGMRSALEERFPALRACVA